MHGLIKKLSRKTNIDIQYVFSGASIIAAGSLTAMITNFILSVAFANLIPPSLYGTYKFVFSIAGIVSIFSLANIGSIITRSVAQGYEGSYLQGVCNKLKYSRVSFIITCGISTYYYLKGDLQLSLLIFIAGSLTPLLQASKFYTALLEGRKDFKKVLLFQFIYSVIPAAVLIFALFQTNNLFIIISAYFASHLIVNILSSIVVFIICKPNKKKNDADAPFAFHLTAMSLLTQIASHADKILIFYFLGATELALYVIATSLALQLHIVTKGIRTVLYPKISSRSIPEIQKTIRFRSLLLFLFALTMFLVYIFISPLLFKIFFPLYVEGIFYSQVFALFILFLPALPYMLALHAHSKAKELYYINTITAVCKILLLLITLPLLGIWGAIISYISAQAVQFILMIYYVHHTK